MSTRIIYTLTFTLITESPISLVPSVCPCGYEYDPAIGDPNNSIDHGTKREDIPEDFECPVCGLGKDAFETLE